MAKFSQMRQQAQQSNANANANAEVTATKEEVATAAQEKPVEKPAEAKGGQDITHSELVTPELKAAIDFIGTCFSGVRQWPGNDGGQYASISIKEPSRLPEGYTSIYEVIEEVLETCSDIKEATGKATFATYQIPIGRTRAEARVLKIQDDGKLACALNVEYMLNGVGKNGSGVVVMEKKVREDKPDDKGKSQAVTTNFGFGKGLGY